jgi:mitogen-activated protein kinase 1/3
MENLIVKEGYLLKRGQMTAKRRYFILEHDERGTSTLSYWGSKQEMENAVPARGLLVLGADSRIQELASIGRRGFTVTAQRKAWSMASETNDPEEGKRWQAALTGAVAKAEAMKRNTIPESNTCVSIYGENRYSVTVSGTEFLLDRRYEDLRPLGHGAYGVVVSALDLALGQKVAIKKCPNVFEDPSDAKRIAREIRLLRHFQHPNIVKLTDLPPPPASDFFDVYMVAEKMDTDLHRVIYSGQTLTEEHIQFFMYQLMCGLKHIHSANVIHRDLKVVVLKIGKKEGIQV